MHQCFACQLERATHHSSKGWRGMLIPPPPGPRLEWSLDLVTELPRSSTFQHVLTCVDVFAKYVLFIPLADKRATTVATAFRERLVAVFGVPAAVRCDNGAEFKGAFHTMAQAYGLTIRRTSAYHSNANG